MHSQISAAAQRDGEFCHSSAPSSTTAVPSRAPSDGSAGWIEIQVGASDDVSATSPQSRPIAGLRSDQGVGPYIGLLEC